MILYVCIRYPSKRTTFIFSTMFLWFQGNRHFFIHLNRLGAWTWRHMMCLDTMTYFVGICIVFEKRIGLPICHCGHMSNLSFTVVFSHVRVPSCDTRNCHLCACESCTRMYISIWRQLVINVMIKYGRYFFGLFPLLWRLRLFLYYCSFSIFWMGRFQEVLGPLMLCPYI